MVPRNLDVGETEITLEAPPRAAPDAKPEEHDLSRIAQTVSPAPHPSLQPDPPTPAPRRRRTLRPRKAAITLTPAAVEQLKALLDDPEPRTIRIGVRNKGCSGLAYHLEYVGEGARGVLDEEVVQDGVRVLVEGRALMSVVGSEMDWVEDRLSARFVFRNPNISECGPNLCRGQVWSWRNQGADWVAEETCGCGESFMTH
jgi:iron-sulfur cluster assembly protein